MTSAERSIRIWPVILAALAGTVLLVALGMWQVQRLAWKEALLAQLAERAEATPVDLAAAEVLMARGEDVEFLRVRLQGRYLRSSPMKMMSTFEGGQGWIIIAPLITEDGRAVLVDRGRVPASGLQDVSTPDGVVVIDGLLRMHSGRKAYFDPENDPAGNLWYWWDVQAMLGAVPIPAGLTSFPAVVQLLPEAGSGQYPRADMPKAGLANNHLGYAITWFGLAMTLVAISALYVRDARRRRKRPLDGSARRG